MYLSLLPNTEFAKYYVKNVLYVNATCDFGDFLGGITKFFCCKDRFLQGYTRNVSVGVEG